MSRAVAAIARGLMRHRWALVIAVVALAIAGAALSTRLRVDFSPQELFAGAAEQQREAEAFRRDFGNTDNILLVLVEADDVMAPPVLAYVGELTERLAARPYAAAAESVATVALPALVEGALVARDGSLAAVAVLLPPEVVRVEQLGPIVADVETELARHPPPPGVRTHLAGLPVMRVDMADKVGADQRVLFPAALLVILLLLYASFRVLQAVILPVIAVGAAAAILVGGMALVGEPLDILNNIVPILVIIIGVTDAIHLVNRYGEELAIRRDQRLAAESSLATMIVALLLTSLTTAVGFGSLVLSQAPALAGFGVTAAVGMLIVYVVVIAFLPPALSLAPRPRRPIARPARGRVERRIAPLVAAAVRRRRWVLGIAAVAAAVGVAVAPGIPIDTAVRHQYTPDDEIYRTIQLLEDRLRGVRPVEIVLRSPTPGRFEDPALLEAMARVSEWARAQPGVLDVKSYADLLAQAARAAQARLERREQVTAVAELVEREAATGLGRFATPARDGARISVALADIGGRATVALVEVLEERLRAELASHDDIDVAITGEGYLSSAGLEVLTEDLLKSLLLAIVVIFAFLTVALRSLRLSLLSVPPNVLPLLLTLVYLRVRDIPLSPATAIIFVISIGLAVDGTIHLLVRFREELAAGRARDAALRAAAQGTGKAVVVSYVSIIVGFQVFQLSAFLPIRQFGELVSVTILGCLVSTLVVLPALIGVAWRGAPGQRS